MLHQILLGAFLFQSLAMAWRPDTHQVTLNDQGHDGLQGQDMDFEDSHYYYGIRTFANLPYVNCFSDREIQDRKYDIAVIGAPHDTVSVLLYRPSPICLCKLV